ncbi:InlB B-repeat-containing protein [Collinsella phocaeensis]|uniref:InlB B-repeat-containing protein n=1 Tax=Collinsella phocaeensis TaxID=1871016 RepID=UPI00093157BC|nr:InlB B-repeat-containing protein [Collinsella phocaeensis]
MRFVDGAWKVSEEPTCTEAGREERTCSTCGEKESRKIPALGHELEAVTEVAATIDAVGTKAHYRCSACDELFLDAEGKQGVDAADLVIERLEAVTVTFDDCIDPKDDHVVVRIAKGGVVSAEDLPEDPQLAGYEFSGWFLYDAAAGTWGDAFDPTEPVTSDLLVGAQWRKLDDGSGEGGSTEKPADKPTKPTNKLGSKPGSGDKDALVQTGDNAFALIAAAFSAGVAAIGAGLFSHRRRSE